MQPECRMVDQGTPHAFPEQIVYPMTLLRPYTTVTRLAEHILFDGKLPRRDSGVR